MQPLCTVNDDFERTIMTKLTLTDGKISGAKVDALVLASTAGEDGATLAEGAALPKNAAAYLTEHLSATDERVAETMQSLLDTEDECSSLYFSLMTTTRSSYVVPIPRQDLYILGQWIQKALEALHVSYLRNQLLVLQSMSMGARSLIFERTPGLR